MTPSEKEVSANRLTHTLQGALLQERYNLNNYSKEELFEESMHAKVALGSIKNQFKTSKMRVFALESKIAQKDKLIDDMCQVVLHKPKNEVFSPRVALKARPVSIQEKKIGATREQFIQSLKRIITEQKDQLIKKDEEIEYMKLTEIK